MTLTLDSIRTGPSKEPPRILLYAPGGIGKTLAASNAPKPIFLQTEDGLGNIDAPHFPLAHKWQEVVDMLTALYQEDHQFQTLVVDSLDWLEPLIWAEVINRKPKSSKGKDIKDISDYGYGEGYQAALDIWNDFFSKINRIRLERNMAVVFLAHDEIKRFDDPEKGTYNYYGPKMHKFATDRAVEFCDIVAFANYQVAIATDTNNFGGETKRVIGQNSRVVMLQEKPAAIAKNRYDLPPEIVIPEGDKKWAAFWGALAAAVPYFKGLTKGEINAPTQADRLPV